MGFKSISISRTVNKLLTTVGMLSVMAGLSPAQAYDWVTVANAGTVIPGAGSKLFSSFNQPSINNNCTVVFRARGKGPDTPPRGIYFDYPCTLTPSPVRKKVAIGDQVPAPNNLAATFNEFPSFARIAPENAFIATRGQHKPVWRYTPVGGTETRVGTAGIYASDLGRPLVTGASLLGAVPSFAYYQVPGYPGVKFDQFPGAPAPFGAKFIAFKGNFTDGTTPRTGIYYRNIYDGGKLPIVKIADTKTTIPGTGIKFGATAPPSAAGNQVVFTGWDNEESPTVGGIYVSRIPPTGVLTPLARIGGPVPGVPGATFTNFGEGLSYSGRDIGYWGAWGTQTRTVRLFCPEDGNADIIAECKRQCPQQIDSIGNYCERQVPVNQGIFVRRPNGETRLLARASARGPFQDFLFWVFSGHVPSGDDPDAELPRWRASAFVANSAYNSTDVSTVFKASKANGESGLYIRPSLARPVEPLILVGTPAGAVDPAAPAGSVVTAVGVERDGFRNCHLAVNASFLNSTTSESWAGVYVEKNACPPVSLGN